MDKKLVPKVRFKEFAGENAHAWEQRKFFDLVKIKRGLTYKPNNVKTYGVRVLRSSNIDDDIFNLKSDDVFVENTSVNIDYVENGDILITAANGSSRLVGKHAIITGITSPTVHGGFMLLAKTDNPNFINSLMSSSWYTKFIKCYVSGGNGAIGNLSKSDLENQIVVIPTPIEQTLIGDFFQTLDRLITLHQRECREREKGE